MKLLRHQRLTAFWADWGWPLRWYANSRRDAFERDPEPAAILVADVVGDTGTSAR